MFQRLRRRFTFIAALVSLAVLFILLASINLVNYVDVIRNANHVISVVRDADGELPPYEEDTDPLEENPLFRRYFIMTADEQGYEITRNPELAAGQSAEYLDEMIRYLVREEKQSGWYGNYRYGRLDLENDNSTAYIFVDCWSELDRIVTFLWNSVVVGAVGLIAVTIGLFFLSGFILKPVSLAYQKQKQFITDAGHEIKTPLTVIAADADLLEMESGETEWTKDIKEQVKRLSDLTTKLIYLAKLDEGVDIPKTEFDLSDCVQESLRNFASVAEVQQIDIRTDIAPGITYLGNRTAIGMLVSILVDNALKYTDDSKVNISLHDDINKTTLSVSNSFIQMQDGNLDYLFERFTRTDFSRDSNSGGHGLGLAIAKSIADFSGAKIKAHASAGIVYFTVTFYPPIEPLPKFLTP